MYNIDKNELKNLQVKYPYLAKSGELDNYITWVNAHPEFGDYLVWAESIAAAKYKTSEGILIRLKNKYNISSDEDITVVGNYGTAIWHSTPSTVTLNVCNIPGLIELPRHEYDMIRSFLIVM